MIEIFRCLRVKHIPLSHSGAHVKYPVNVRYICMCKVKSCFLAPTLHTGWAAVRMDYEGLSEETSLSNSQHARVMLQQRYCDGKGLILFGRVSSRPAFDPRSFRYIN